MSILNVHTKKSQYNISEAKAQLSELIEQALLGKAVVIARDHKPLVTLKAYYPAKAGRQLGTAKGLLKIASDFNEPLEDFKDYV
jgi:antitoxin (DNA-binding transcriptional repressor) of toxin-antitoxin stability system